MSDKHWDGVKDVLGQHSLQLGSQFAFQALYTPRHLAFVFSRYKFAAKMLNSKPGCRVLELGCGEGVGALLLAEEGHPVVGVDFDKEAISYAKEHLANHDKFDLNFVTGDITDMDLGKFGAVVSLDVIEHVEQSEEDMYVRSIHDHLDDEGFCCIGTPNITSQEYASERSRIGHVNLFDADRLQALLGKYFKNVFLFGMNDEVLHTGFHPMCHYLMALGCGKR
jgi:2-polyprenyl-3-methyl-5-hydroxy-6-metoxy-1,4-benzoquinol methylase